MHRGGAERVAAALCNRMAQEGWEVILMPTFSGKGDCLYRLDENVTLDYLSDRAAGVSQGSGGKWKRFLALRKAIKEYAPDTVVSFLTHVNVITLFAAMGLNVPVVVSERVYPPAWGIGNFWSRLRKLTYPRAKAVVMQTNKGRVWLQTAIPQAVGHVIPNPVLSPENGARSSTKAHQLLCDSRKMLLAVGRLEKQKGFDILINVFARLSQAQPDWNLVILGEGGERLALERQVKEANLAQRVFLPGAIENVEQWYERAEAFVLSSRFEGFPNVLLEAMAHGLPVVAVDCDTGPSDCIKHGDNGLLAAYSEDGSALEVCLRDLLSDARLREVLGRNAQEVRAQYSIEKVFEAWRSLL